VSRKKYGAEKKLDKDLEFSYTQLNLTQLDRNAAHFAIVTAANQGPIPEGNRLHSRVMGTDDEAHEFRNVSARPRQDRRQTPTEISSNYRMAG